MFSLLPVLGLILCVKAAFVHPPPFIGTKNRYQDNPRYAWGSDVQFQWVTDAPKDVSLSLIIVYPITPASYFMTGDLSIEGLTTVTKWNANLYGRESLVKDGEDGICFLRLRDIMTHMVQFDSSYFNVTVPKDVATTVTTTQAISSPTSTPTSTSRTPTTTLTSPSATSQPDEGSASGLSKGTVGGIAAGATIGGILVLGGLAFALWSRRKKRDANKVRDPGQGVTELQSEARRQVKGHRAKTQSAELDSGPVYEMP